MCEFKALHINCKEAHRHTFGEEECAHIDSEQENTCTYGGQEPTHIDGNTPPDGGEEHVHTDGKQEHTQRHGERTCMPLSLEEFCAFYDIQNFRWSQVREGRGER